MKLKFLIACVFLFLYGIVALSQALTQKIVPLKIGDKLPYLVFKDVIRYKNGRLDLKDFKGKPLIIDFWFTYCGVCVAEMPHLDSMRARYSDKLNVLLTTFEPKNEIESFFVKTHKVKNVTLPSLTSDTILTKIFPHTTAPHQVWIDRNGIVKAITDGEQITEENIQRLISGAELNLPLKDDTRQIEIDKLGYQPMVFIDNKFNAGKSTEFYSFLGGYMEGLGAVIGSPGIVKQGGFSGCLMMSMSNGNLSALYDRINSKQFYPNQIQCDESILAKLTGDWSNKKDIFCYELISRDTNIVNFKRRMLLDIDNSFNLTSLITKKMVKCYVIKSTNNGESLISKGSDRDSFMEGNVRHFVNIPWWAIFENFISGSFNPKYEVIDETKLLRNTKVDLNILANWNDLAEVNEQLLKYNVKIVVEERLKNFLTINKRNN
ncbi:Redoxin [Mucilaginibacter pineti]|uniref:Redoxin n=1 Tax=Mucilaginibacter pineti TaxID=1391627 RepID=A0A1G7ES01_9SPHI|nr:TlpA disulfide reductase family protein [Mucilaginibacter pineti]SDE66387.1 Redoxin [Mucilaginibacter pineti]